ncbi:hypothetical protein J132_07904 [Termitomyces sp. J132]|nr:hypothetical protein J132_07904 [Termitomyces sp. J132]
MVPSLTYRRNDSICVYKGRSSARLTATSAQRPAQLTRGQLAQCIRQINSNAMGDHIPRVPSPEEVVFIRKETESQIKGIKSLEDAKELGEPRSLILTIEESLVLARAHYSAYFPRIFRINDLPTEILTNIFRLIVWPVPNPSTGILWRLWLTWTCRRWRQVALGDCTLWNAIWFRDRPPFKRSWAFLERAGTSTLDLRISSEDTTPISLAEMDHLLNRLLTCLSQIRILIYIGSSWEHIALLLDKLRAADVPLAIERLEIHRLGRIDYGTYGYIQPTALFNGKGTPRLHYLSLSGVHIDWNTSILQNLSTIDIRKLPLELSPTITRFREILISCPALRKLCLDGAGPQIDLYDLPPFQIVMTKLKILCISDFSAQYARHVFSHFTAPNLVDLTFINMTGEDYSPLYEILVNRFPEIRLLTMYAVDLPVRSKALVQWLISMPQLTYLRIANLPSTFFELFVLDPRTLLMPHEKHPLPEVILAPKLAVIESHPSVIRSLPWFAVQRRMLGVPLNKVYITQTKDHDMTNQEFQKTCVELMKSTSLHFMFNGTRTPEEDAILSEGYR